MKLNKAFQRAAALLAAVSMALSMTVSAFAKEFWISDGDITITVNGDGSQNVKQTTSDGKTLEGTVAKGEDVVIRGGSKTATLEETNEDRPAADFAPVADETETDEQPEEDSENTADENGEAETPVEEDKAEEPAEGNAEEEPAEEPAPEESEAADGTPEEKAEQSTDENNEQAASTQENAAPEQPAAAPAAEAVEPQADDADRDFVQNVIKIISDVAGKVAKVTLDNVKIKAGGAAMNITGQGNVEIELDGDNELKSGSGCAGINKGDNVSTGKLTIKDDNGNAGSLKAAGGDYGAGIGGGRAQGGSNIEITGGNVTATGGTYGAGIGGGGRGYQSNGDSGKNITISGGTVIATGGHDGAGIGGGRCGSGSNIKITNGNVTATGGSGGAGIGGGGFGNGTGNGSDITITGGTVIASSKEAGAGIGGGSNGSGKNITITGGNVTATGSYAGAGIGGGAGGRGTEIAVSGDAEVTAVAGEGHRYAGAGASVGNGGRYGADGAGGVGWADITGIHAGTGYIHHFYADGNDYWEPERPTPKPEPEPKPEPTPDPEQPDTPSTQSAAVESLPLHVENFFGTELHHTTTRDGGTLTLTVNDAFARIHGSLAAVRELQAQGVSTIVFVSSLQTTTVSVSDLLARGADSDEFALRHDGLLSALTVGGEVLAAPCAKA